MRRLSPLKTLGLILAAIVAVYLVVRGIVELFTIDYSAPASYGHDWGGPTLIGVLAVHTGPAAVIVLVTSILAWRRYRVRRSPMGER